jgi:membrane protease YdiL (CAAX protease family)
MQMQKQIARRGLAVYFSVLVSASALLEWKILQTGESIDKLPGLVMALMYVPALASVISRVALREGFADVSFRFGRHSRRAMATAWVFPILVGLLAYGIAWAVGLASFQSPLSPQSHLFVDSSVGNFFRSLILTTTLGTIISCISAFGEELGWRGYMLTRLIASGVARPVFVSALIWGLWHVPLIVSGQYASGSNPWLSTLLFVIGIFPSAYLVAYLRLRSGSVWPAVIFHGAWNAIIQGTFDRATVGVSNAVGESGWLTMVVTFIVAWFVIRGPWTLRERPGEALSMPFEQGASVSTL